MFVKRLAIVVCWAIAFGAAAARAEPDVASIDATLKTCLAKAGGVTPAIDICFGKAASSVDTLLNRFYGDWIKQLEAPGQTGGEDNPQILKRLVASERAWIPFRDTECNLESISMLGGTGETLAYGNCLYTETRRRLLDLRRIKTSR